jgi:hypothetical protein
MSGAAVLGCYPRQHTGPVAHYTNGNTAPRATGRQPARSDCEFEQPNYSFAMAVNINLVNTSSENGAAELWLGDHNCSTPNILSFRLDEWSLWLSVKVIILS